MQTFNSILLLTTALVGLASTASANPVRFESTGTFAPNPSISTIATLTNSQPACVEFGSCSTLSSSPGLLTETYGTPISSLSNKPTVVAPTDSAQSSSYQASLAAAGATSFFSSLTSSAQAASSSAAAATTTAPTGAAAPALTASGYTFGAGLLAFAAVFVMI
ncbi:hypothetical protein OC846_002715 [Tilletia horrida]|uniref:Uncharacterized protein n=1 Tax=Tilletia horrida TaxID=155126 RepID=A0AAN6JYM3_9BASI|nr:hypothetical protein OC846_002715 [Tilletia horrida]KAK0567232.1 hypothetical protein OC861_002829 [Tilletia horrida]